jgi:hypothetical protein
VVIKLDEDIKKVCNHFLFDFHYFLYLLHSPHLTLEEEGREGFGGERDVERGREGFGGSSFDRSHYSC